MEIVIGMGVDKDENTGKILLTAQVVKEEEAGEQQVMEEKEARHSGMCPVQGIRF